MKWRGAAGKQDDVDPRKMHNTRNKHQNWPPSLTSCTEAGSLCWSQSITGTTATASEQHFACDEQNWSNEVNKTHQPGWLPPPFTIHKDCSFGNPGILPSYPFLSLLFCSGFPSMLQCRRTHQLPGPRWLRGARLSPAASALGASNLPLGSPG